MKKENLILLYVFVMVILCTNPANALIVNFDVSGNAVQRGNQVATFSGTAILDVDDIPLQRWYDPSTGYYYNNYYDIFNSFTVNLLSDSGERYCGSFIISGEFGASGIPPHTILALNGFGRFQGTGLGGDTDIPNKHFQFDELLSETFTPTWQFRGSDAGPGIGLSLYFSESPAPVPEPATMLLLGSGLLGVAGFRKKLTRKV